MWPDFHHGILGACTTFSAEALHDFPSEWPGVVERLVVGLRSEQNVVDSEWQFWYNCFGPRIFSNGVPAHLAKLYKLFKGLRLTAGRRPSNDLWLMVWEDWAEILRANPGRAMVNWGRHNAQCLPVWKQSGPMLSAGCAHVEPSRAVPKTMRVKAGRGHSRRLVVPNVAYSSCKKLAPNPAVGLGGGA